MIEWKKQFGFDGAPADVIAYVGPYRLEVVGGSAGLYCRVENMNRVLKTRATWGAKCADIEAGKAACEGIVLRWLKEERDEMSKLIAEVEAW